MNAQAGRVAVVTGASRGIGLAIAQRLVDDGATVCITGRKGGDLQSAVQQLGPAHALAVAGHADDTDHQHDVVDTVMRTYGRIDMLVNNTGINPILGALAVSAEAAEATRDMARRGLTLSEFTRSIRFGHEVLTTAFFDAVSAAVTPPEDRSELRRVSLLLFKLIDEFIAEMTLIFLDEQSAWGASKSAAQVELVKKIVEGDPTDLHDAERLFSYPLNGPHLAIIAWSASPGERTAHGLRAAIDPVLRCWGPPQASLVIPVGSNTLWRGAPFPPRRTVNRAVAFRSSMGHTSWWGRSEPESKGFAGPISKRVPWSG